MKRLIVIGASGHGKVIADIALNNDYNIVGFLDDNLFIKQVMGFPVLGTIKEIIKYQENSEFIIAIGNNAIRKQVAEEHHNIKWATLIHPKATVSMNVMIGKGTVIMANVTINPDTMIGSHCIINTGSVIEHDNKIGDYAHISPNVALGGTVHIGDETHIGIGSVVKNNIKICERCIIGAGGVVVKDIDTSGIYVGVPAKLK